MTTTADIQAWLTTQIAGILSVSENEIDPNGTFDSFGLASRDAVSLSGDLEDYLGRRLSPTLLYQYPTIQLLAEHLVEREAKTSVEKGRGDPQAALGSPQLVIPTLSEEDTPTISGEAVLWTEEEAEEMLLKKLLELDD